MSQEIHDKIIDLVCMGDDHAKEVILKISHFVRVWDDLYDQDAKVSKESIDKSFSDLCFNLSLNPFYREYRDRIESVIFIGWNAWSDANLWKDSEDKLKKSCAWFIRDYINEIVFLIAWIKGGPLHVRKISEQIRTFYLYELAQNETRVKE